MANFKAHLAAGLLAAVPAAYLAGIPGAAACIAGSIAPDLDCDHCVPQKLFFYGLAAAQVTWFYYLPPDAAVTVMVFGLLAVAAFREIFHALTKHRGFMHTPLFAVAFGALIALSVNWQAGLAGAAGVFVHFMVDYLSTGWVWRRKKSQAKGL